MSLSPGTSLGPYEIEAPLGAGGMGEVYKARDTRLERTVAIKVLPEHLASDPDRRRSFEKEAKTISSLNHPHICTLYDIGEHEGTGFLVMEHLEGETLSDRLAREGALTTEDAVRYGSQIASALEKAHQWKIIHRDLKPSNVMLTESGAKVLDFGIATREADPALETVTRSATSLTGDGIAGTVPYMAPEALRGEPADARSDVWGLGILLYEMLGGRRPFTGSTGVEVTSAIMRDPPPALPETVPSGLETIVQRCLKKDPTQRYQRAGEVQAALQATSTVPDVAGGAGTAMMLPAWLTPRLSRRALVALTGAAVVVASVLGWNLVSSRDGAAPAGTPAAMTALAVLPFDNLSGDAAQDYLSEGMTDALITELSKIQALTVASRTSVARFQDSDETVPEIARILGVDAVVGGSIVTAGDQVRVTAQLIDGATDQNLWAESFDRDFEDILALQSEIARAVATGVRVAVTQEEEASLAAPRPVNRQAYEAYLTGKYHADRWPGELPQAVEAFELAIAEDSGYAPAFAGLAISYTLAAYYDIGTIPLPRIQILPRAKDLAERALAFDDSLAEAHLASGFVKMAYEWDWAGTKVAFERALELDPDDKLARTAYAMYLSWIEGRTADAVAYGRQTLEQDPLSLDLNARLAMLLYFAREFDEAIDVARLVLERDPEFSDARTWLGFSLGAAGRVEEIQALPRPHVAGFVMGLLRTGRTEEARQIMQGLVDQPDSPIPESGWGAGLAYGWMGDKDRAFAALNDFEFRNATMSNIRMDPRFDTLRDDPRWDVLMARMKLPGY